MPSPIGHTLLAFSVTGFQNKSSLSMAGWYLLILIAGVAPDFDFLPGILIGDPNHFHHGPTHSILAGVVFTVFMYLIIKPLNLKAAVLIFLVYLTHVLADALSADSGAPYGVPLFWPFSPDYLISRSRYSIILSMAAQAGDSIIFWEMFFRSTTCGRLR